VASKHKFLIHNQGDHVGVATEDIKSGEDVIGVYMDTDETTSVRSRGDVPLGHKIALVDLPEGADVIEYRTRVGLTKSAITRGDYVHVHNIKTARW
jgi:(2R)-sulfolactate sulfo-lyase subunit alpha